MTRTRLPFLHTAAALFVAAALILAPILGTLFGAAPAHAAPAVCTTDFDCALYELSQAVDAGKPIHEDLSFDGMSPLYAAKNDLVADVFWSGTDSDWPAAKAELGCFIRALRS